MARPLSDETKKQKTMESLLKSIKIAGMDEKFYRDKVDEYMSFYDDLMTINGRLSDMKSDKNFSLKAYTEATAEKRRISSEMRSILIYLGLKPVNGGGAGGAKYEEL